MSTVILDNIRQIQSEHPKVPRTEIRECCAAIFFGELKELSVKLSDPPCMKGTYYMPVKYCFVCGGDMVEYRKKAEEKLKERWQKREKKE